MRVIHLVRHAKAADRLTWNEPDVNRPLSEKGHRQAEALAAHFTGTKIDTMLTSPARRCLDTIQPLADQLELTPIIRDELMEGGIIELPRDEGTHVLCAHGDNIPKLLSTLDVTATECAKASIWTLTFHGDELLVNAVYTPPPQVNVRT